MQLLHAHRRAMDEFDRRVHLIGANQWNNRTPCTEWTVRDLLNHLVAEQLWAPRLLAGASLHEVGDRFDGDVLGSDPAKAWSEASAQARHAWDAPGAATGEVNITGGVIPTEDYGWQMTGDLAVHAWDLARGIDTADELDPNLVTAVHARLGPQVEAWQGLGLFDPPRPIEDTAGEQTRLLALLGRGR